MKANITKLLGSGLIGSLLIISTGCESTSQRTEDATVVGAIAGGVLGGVVGHNVGDGGNEALGAVIGATAGGMAGREYGKRQDDIDTRISNAERAANTVTINIQNSNGSYTPVTLMNIGNGQYRGPRGEIYNGIPTEDQLRGIYGI